MGGTRSKHAGESGTHLHLNVQDTNALLGGDVFDCFHTGPVVVSTELGVLDKSVLGDEIQELFFRDEVIFAAVLLAGSRGTSSI